MPLKLAELENKPAEGLRQNEGEDAGDEKENNKERYSLGWQHFRLILGSNIIHIDYKLYEFSL